MANRMTVHFNGNPIYDIVMEPTFDRLSEEVKNLNIDKRKICIVTDTNVAPLYLEQVSELLGSCCEQLVSFVFTAGEENKNLDTVRDLYKFLIQSRFDRNDYLAALGGGVVGDLCGFAAATYLRGISFIQIPTTLLSQVDSSIGGKTGVDFDSYKNMVGAFHMPSLVYENVAALLTLPEEQMVSGMGEVVKHGLIKDQRYYQWLKVHAEDIKARDLDILEEMVVVSNEIKRAVVEQDPKEMGERALLNLGHTLGHAIEKLKEFRMLHGQCVGVGCLAAAYLSQDRGLIPAEEVAELEQLLVLLGFPVVVAGITEHDVVQASKLDKKMDSGIIKFILLQKVGNAYIDRTVSEEEMCKALRRILV